MIASPWIAALFALLLWWMSTGAILWLVKGAEARHRDRRIAAVLIGLVVAFAGVAGAFRSLDDPSPAGAYLAFVSALAIWGWIEFAFLSGIVTGPNTAPLPPIRGEWDRFVKAWGTVTYHELLLLAALVLLFAASRDAANTFAFWTFAVLFFARISAKMNLFFGVPRIHTEFLPRALSHLPSYFRRGNVSALFPVAITALSFATACWLERTATATTPGATVGFALLAALSALALLEHWLMVLPLPDEKLWRWMIPAPKTHDKRTLTEDPHGL
jgi:putative photosynthetic complex assembly protein 2